MPRVAPHVLALCLLAAACTSGTHATRSSGSFAVTGLEATAHRPILVLSDGLITYDPKQWKDSYEALPTVTVYEDGLVIRAIPAGTTTGHIDDPAGLARRIAASLAQLPPRLDVTNATDQPSSSIAVRVGDAWRCVLIAGLTMSGRVESPSAEVPLAFLAAREAVRTLAIRDEHPFPFTDFTVTMHDDTLTSPAAPWPSDVPAPPKLVGNPSYFLNPRSYELRGDAGVVLHAFARARGAYPVTTPSGERVSLAVDAVIPDEAYIDRVHRCASADNGASYRVCDDK